MTGIAHEYLESEYRMNVRPIEDFLELYNAENGTKWGLTPSYDSVQGSPGNGGYGFWLKDFGQDSASAIPLVVRMDDYEASSDGRQRLTATCESRLHGRLSEVFGPARQ